MSAFSYTGGSFFGYRKDPTIDEYDRKQGLRHNRRRPIDETISELGEGRGTKRFCQALAYRIFVLTITRYLRTRIRGEKSRKNQRTIWHAC